MTETSLRRLERRHEPRLNTKIGAEIVFGAGRRRVACIIRNLSRGGARLEFAAWTREIPQTFDLVRPDHRTQPCRVVWRALKELGVAFV